MSVKLARVQSQIDETLRRIAEQEAKGRNPKSLRANLVRLQAQLAVAEVSGSAPASTVAEVRETLRAQKVNVALDSMGVTQVVPAAAQVVEANMGAIVPLVIEQLAPSIGALVMQLLLQLGIPVILSEIVDYIQESGITDVQSLFEYFKENYKGAANVPGGIASGLRLSVTSDPENLQAAMDAIAKDPLCSTWRPVTRPKWFKKQKTLVKGWYKHYLWLTEEEVRSYHMAQYRTALFWRKKGYESYKDGFKDGAHAQQRKEKAIESGTTPVVNYYPKNRR